MTTFTEIRNDYVPGYYVEPYINDDGEEEPYTSGIIAGTGDITTLVTGDLATRVQVRSDRFGDVTIVESHWDDGYCVTCSYEQTAFYVYIGDERVYATDSYDYPENAEALSSFGKFNEWLNGEDN